MPTRPAERRKSWPTTLPGRDIVPGELVSCIDDPTVKVIFFAILKLSVPCKTNKILLRIYKDITQPFFGTNCEDFDFYSVCLCGFDSL